MGHFSKIIFGESIQFSSKTFGTNFELQMVLAWFPVLVESVPELVGHHWTLESVFCPVPKRLGLAAASLGFDEDVVELPENMLKDFGGRWGFQIILFELQGPVLGYASWFQKIHFG